MEMKDITIGRATEPVKAEKKTSQPEPDTVSAKKTEKSKK